MEDVCPGWMLEGERERLFVAVDLLAVSKRSRRALDYRYVVKGGEKTYSKIIS